MSASPKRRSSLWGLSSSAWAARRLVAGVSPLMPGAYLLAMFAYLMAPLSYAGAVRAVSVILGALAGRLLFGERPVARRVLGVAVISLGTALVAALGSYQMALAIPHTNRLRSAP